MGNEKAFEKHARTWRALRIALLALGIMMLTFGVSLIFIVPIVVESQVRQSIRLTRGNELFDMWLNPPYKTIADIFVYSVENPDEVLNGSKPELSSIGPYRYDQKLWNELDSSGNGTVKYRSYRRFDFNANDSCDECKLSRKVWIPNMVYQKFVEAASNPSMKAAQGALTSQTPFLEVSVEDMLFRGYTDPYLVKVCSVPFMNLICELILELPDKIAFLGDKNQTNSGVFEASTGEFDNGDSIGRLMSWNEEEVLPEQWWGDEFSIRINGSDGSLYKPYVQKSDLLYVFSPDICRSIYLVFEREVNYGGVPGYRFIAPEKLLDSSLPENEGFCVNSGKTFYDAQRKDCLPKGLIDLSRCQKGEPPIILSLPNFLYADNMVKESIIGMNDSTPDADGIAVEIEPRTGVLLRVERRLQINIAMWKGEDITEAAGLNRMHSVIVPIISYFETTTIDDATLQGLYDRLIKVDNAAFAISLTSICTGLFVIAAVFTVFAVRSERFSSYINDRRNKITRVTISPIPEKPYSLNTISKGAV